MSELCRWLHEELERLPLIKFPFRIKELPKNGIYFFYEEDEIWGHAEDSPRIVRIDTHNDGNFRNRINEHFLLNGSKMNFNKNKLKPSDRSIFRKNIGRALLNRDGDNYLEIWEIGFTTRKNRDQSGDKRDIDKEKRIELEITKILRENFSFRFIIIDSEMERRLEGPLIGTVASCKLCKPSDNWLGNYSPKEQIKESGLWQVQHLGNSGINKNDKEIILNAIKRTEE